MNIISALSNPWEVDIPLNIPNETKLTRIGFMYSPNPFTRAGCDTRLILKQSLTGLISESSFSSNGYHAKVKAHN